MFDTTWIDALLESRDSWGSVAMTAVRIAAIVIAAWISIVVGQHAVRRLRVRIANRLDDREAVQRAETLGRVVRYLIAVVISAIALMLVLGEIGISVAPILGAAGVAGLAIGFGAQSLVKDYFTGFFLLLENQIRIGDVIDAGGKSGLVEEITLRYLRLRDYSGNVHYVPNGQITVVTNMSVGYAYAVIDLGVAYGEDTDRVIEIMRKTGEDMRRDPEFASKILDDMEVAGVDQWADSSVVIRCRFRVPPLEQWGIRREYLRRAKQAFDREGIEIPFPHVKLVPSGPEAAAA